MQNNRSAGGANQENLFRGVNFHQDISIQTIVTDASLTSWSSHMDHLQIQGMGSLRKQSYHNNLLEPREVNVCPENFPPAIQDELSPCSDEEYNNHTLFEHYLH